MNAWFHELYKILGIFIPLIVTNCAIIGRAEVCLENSLDRSLVDNGDGDRLHACFDGTQGAAEMLGMGTLLAADLMFGEIAKRLDAEPR